MRVTNSMLVSNFMNDLNVNLTKLSNIQQQMASGRKNAHLSDDPVALIYSQQARYKLSRLGDYETNVKTAGEWLVQVETGTMEINDIIKSVYETCIDAATDVKNDVDLKNTAAYVKQMRDQVLQTLNTALGDKYVFGGYNTTTGYDNDGKPIPPFTVKEVVVGGKTQQHLCYNGVDLTSTDPDDLALLEELRQDVLTFDIAAGASMPVTVNGIDLAFYGKGPNGENLNIYNLLDDLYNVMTADPVYDIDGNLVSKTTAEDIQAFITELQSAQDHTLTITADLGGRERRIDILSSRYGQDTINYTQMLSDAEDIDFAEVVMNYKMAESVYKAALSSGSYIIQPTLMDFLR